jgi:Tfp pilus assembly protein PilN
MRTMINLLPPYWKRKLEEEGLFKTVAIMGTVFAMSATAFVLMLALVRIYFSIELKYAQIAAEEKEKEMEILNVKATEDEISSRNQFVAKVKNFYASQAPVAGMIGLVARALPEGVTLSSLSLSGSTVHLTGFSPDRNSLVVFKSNLEKDPSFKNIVFPPENWLMAQNISFSINLEYEH